MPELKKVMPQSTAKKSSSIFVFFALVIVLSIPFWVLGGLTGIQLLPGLPIDTFMVVCPVLAACILIYKENGKQGVLRLLKYGVDIKSVNPKGWYSIAFLLMPLVSVFVFFWLRLEGTMVPDPEINAFQIFSYIILFFAGALGEELGWTGYLTDPLLRRFGALNTSIIIGLFWAAYHWIALIQVGRPLEWIAWWSIGTIVLRVILIWLYSNSGRSIFIATLFHMTINLTWQLFPVNGSYYSPSKTSLILLIITVCIVLYYGPRTLTRERKTIKR